jgi:hypothetical protein
MASSGKKKTTMAKINRENSVRERRARKQQRKDQRKVEGPDTTVDTLVVEDRFAAHDTSLDRFSPEDFTTDNPRAPAPASDSIS